MIVLRPCGQSPKATSHLCTIHRSGAEHPCFLACIWPLATDLPSKQPHRRVMNVHHSYNGSPGDLGISKMRLPTIIACSRLKRHKKGWVTTTRPVHRCQCELLKPDDYSMTCRVTEILYAFFAFSSWTVTTVGRYFSRHSMMACSMSRFNFAPSSPSSQ